MEQREISITNGRDEPDFVRGTATSAAKIYCEFNEFSSTLHSFWLSVTVCCESTGASLEGCQTSLELSLIRRRSTVLKKLSIDRLCKSPLDLTEPSSFNYHLEQFDCHLVPLDEDGKVLSKSICTTSVSTDWQTLNFVSQYDRKENPCQLSDILNLVMEGDQLVLWMVTKGPGLDLHIKEASLDARFPAIYLPKQPVEQVRQSTYPDGRREFVIPDDDVLPTKDNGPEGECLRPREEVAKARVLHTLQHVWPGDWVMIECDGKRAAQPATGVDGKPKSDKTQDAAVRSVLNPCSHYRQSLLTRNIRCLILIISNAPGEKLELLLLTFNRAMVKGTNGGYTHYKALSYTWGDLKKTKEVILNHIHEIPSEKGGGPGICYRHAYNITQNLHDFLSTLAVAAAGKPIFFWADAICIDQNNIDERNDQVSVIGEVYMDSGDVTLWLGDHADVIEPSHLGLSSLKNFLQQKYGDKYDPYNFKPEYTKSYEHEHKPYCTTCCDATLPLHHYFRLPWFRRVWVLQEVFQASANVSILEPSGKGMIDFDTLATGMGYQRNQSSLSINDSNVLAPFLWTLLCSRLRFPNHIYRNLSRHNIDPDSENCHHKSPLHLNAEDRLTILHLFQQALDFEATDPRDKIYALFGLARELYNVTILPKLITPDYSQKLMTVFTNFTRFCIIQMKTLDVLSVTSMTARRHVLNGSAPMVPERYPFPPLEHATWAMWHTPKKKWTVLRSRNEPNYNNMTCSGTIFSREVVCQDMEDSHYCSCHVDTTLVGNELDSGSLRLRGLELDEVAAVFPVCVRNTDHGCGYIGDAKDPTHSALWRLWEMILDDHRNSRPCQSDFIAEKGEAASEDSEIALFSEFLLTLICDMYRSKHDPGDGFQPYETKVLAEGSAAFKSLMHNFVPYWLTSQPGRSPAECGVESIPITGSQLPPLQTNNLPEAIVKAWEAVRSDLSVFDSQQITIMKTFAAEYLHHITGQWFFRSGVSGRIGVCPYGTKIGDKIVALYGAVHASVLRHADDPPIEPGSPSDADSRAWLFIGEARVQKWLNGGFEHDPKVSQGLREEIWTIV